MGAHTRLRLTRLIGGKAVSDGGAKSEYMELALLRQGDAGLIAVAVLKFVRKVRRTQMIAG